MQVTNLLTGIYKVIFFALGMAICHSVSVAAEYYVSPTGSASWPGCTNINTPCSLQTGGDNAVAGDTVYLRGGTYYLPAVNLPSCNDRYICAFQPANSGTSDNLITFKAYQGEIPFLDNRANDNRCQVIASFGVKDTNYTIFDGLHSKAVMSGDQAGLGGRGWAGQLVGTTGSVIRNCNLEGINGASSNNNSIRIDYSNHCLVENNILHGGHQSGGAHHNSAAVMMYHNDHITVQNNTIYDNDCGIFDKEDGDYNIHRLNFIRNCAYGVNIGTYGAYNQGIEVYQNVFIDITHDFAMRNSDGDSSGSDRYKFYNNTMYNVGGGLRLLDSSITTNVEFFNNIAYTVGTANAVEPGNISYLDHNLYYDTNDWRADGMWGSDRYTTLSSWKSGTGWDTNSNANDPNFVNAGGTNPEDYKRTSYPQDGRSGSYASVMGAYITGNEVIGYSGDGAQGPPPEEIDFPQEFQLESFQ